MRPRFAVHDLAIRTAPNNELVAPATTFTWDSGTPSSSTWSEEQEIAAIHQRRA
jgi:hypothetical protein